MELWNWDIFIDEFAPPVLVASLLLTALGMLVKWAWSRSRQVVFWVSTWLIFVTVLAFVFVVLRPTVEMDERADLSVSLEQNTFTNSTLGQQAGLLAIINALVSNTGAPSSVATYRLVIDVGDRTYSGTRLQVPDKLNVPFPDGSSITFLGEDALDIRTLTPIPRGGFARGTVMFFFADLTMAVVKTAGARARLSVEDAWKREVFAEPFSIDALNSSAPNVVFPGLSQAPSGAGQ